VYIFCVYRDKTCKDKSDTANKDKKSKAKKKQKKKRRSATKKRMAGWVVGGAFVLFFIWLAGV
jgi:hypothetical protein